MRIAYRIKEKDFLEAQKLYLTTGPPSQRLLRKFILIMGLILVATGVASLTPPFSKVRSDLLPGILVGAAFVFAIWVVPRLSAKKRFSKDKRLQSDIVVEFSEFGMELSTGNSSAKVAWTDCIRYRESENLFAVFQSPQLFNIFPKRAFASGDADEFRELLNRKLAASR
ncbi:MAG: YcxB family protein [Candidatus Acidiferrales bacterium]